MEQPHDPADRIGRATEQARALLDAPPRVVNVGLELFGAERYSGSRPPVVQVDWQPRAGGDPRVAALLTRLTDRPQAANGPARRAPPPASTPRTPSPCVGCSTASPCSWMC